MLTRRRFLCIAAASSAAGLAALAGMDRATEGFAWHGVALGAPARIVIDGDRSDAGPIVSGVLAEIERLEKLFSLYRADSAISALNRSGALLRPAPDFLALLSVSDRLHAASGGAFDPTMQPAWSALAERHTGGSARRPVAADWKSVAWSTDRVAFARPGMAISLNGIAQGYITDRIAGLLSAAGLDHLLVDMGEIRTVGTRADGSAWPVGIRSSHGAASFPAVRLRGGRALAVSESRGTTFDRQGVFGHIIDPRTGRAMARDRLIAVEAPTAALADGLSTALCVTGCERHASVLERIADCRVLADSDRRPSI